MSVYLKSICLVSEIAGNLMTSFLHPRAFQKVLVSFYRNSSSSTSAGERVRGSEPVRILTRGTGPAEFPESMVIKQH